MAPQNEPSIKLGTSTIVILFAAQLTSLVFMACVRGQNIQTISLPPAGVSNISTTSEATNANLIASNNSYRTESSLRLPAELLASSTEARGLLARLEANRRQLEALPVDFRGPPVESEAERLVRESQLQAEESRPEVAEVRVAAPANLGSGPPSPSPSPPPPVAFSGGSGNTYMSMSRDGSNKYQFGFDTRQTSPQWPLPESNSPRLMREESRLDDGTVVGRYGYTDPFGLFRIVQYVAGPEGYFATEDVGGSAGGPRPALNKQLHKALEEARARRLAGSRLSSVQGENPSSSEKGLEVSSSEPLQSAASFRSEVAAAAATLPVVSLPERATSKLVSYATRINHVLGSNGASYATAFRPVPRAPATRPPLENSPVGTTIDSQASGQRPSKLLSITSNNYEPVRSADALELLKRKHERFESHFRSRLPPPVYRSDGPAQEASWAAPEAPQQVRVLQDSTALEHGERTSGDSMLEASPAWSLLSNNYDDPQRQLLIHSSFTVDHSSSSYPSVQNTGSKGSATPSKVPLSSAYNSAAAATPSLIPSQTWPAAQSSDGTSVETLTGSGPAGSLSFALDHFNTPLYRPEVHETSIVEPSVGSAQVSPPPVRPTAAPSRGSGETEELAQDELQIRYATRLSGLSLLPDQADAMQPDASEPQAAFSTAGAANSTSGLTSRARTPDRAKKLASLLRPRAGSHAAGDLSTSGERIRRPVPMNAKRISQGSESEPPVAVSAPKAPAHVAVGTPQVSLDRPRPVVSSGKKFGKLAHERPANQLTETGSDPYAPEERGLPFGAAKRRPTLRESSTSAPPVAVVTPELQIQEVENSSQTPSSTSAPVSVSSPLATTTSTTTTEPSPVSTSTSAATTTTTTTTTTASSTTSTTTTTTAPPTTTQILPVASSLSPEPKPEVAEVITFAPSATYDGPTATIIDTTNQSGDQLKSTMNRELYEKIVKIQQEIANRTKPNETPELVTQSSPTKLTDESNPRIVESSIDVRGAPNSLPVASQANGYLLTGTLTTMDNSVDKSDFLAKLAQEMDSFDSLRAQDIDESSTASQPRPVTTSTPSTIQSTSTSSSTSSTPTTSTPSDSTTTVTENININSDADVRLALEKASLAQGNQQQPAESSVSKNESGPEVSKASANSSSADEAFSLLISSASLRMDGSQASSPQPEVLENPSNKSERTGESSIKSTEQVEASTLEIPRVTNSSSTTTTEIPLTSQSSASIPEPISSTQPSITSASIGAQLPTGNDTSSELSSTSRPPPRRKFANASGAKFGRLVIKKGDKVVASYHAKEAVIATGSGNKSETGSGIGPANFQRRSMLLRRRPQESTAQPEVGKVQVNGTLEVSNSTRLNTTERSSLEESSRESLRILPGDLSSKLEGSRRELTREPRALIALDLAEPADQLVASESQPSVAKLEVKPSSESGKIQTHLPDRLMKTGRSLRQTSGSESSPSPKAGEAKKSEARDEKSEKPKPTSRLAIGRELASSRTWSSRLASGRIKSPPEQQAKQYDPKEDLRKMVEKIEKVEARSAASDRQRPSRRRGVGPNEEASSRLGVQFERLRENHPSANTTLQRSPVTSRGESAVDNATVSAKNVIKQQEASITGSENSKNSSLAKANETSTSQSASLKPGNSHYGSANSSTSSQNWSTPSLPEEQLLSISSPVINVRNETSSEGHKDDRSAKIPKTEEVIKDAIFVAATVKPEIQQVSTSAPSLGTAVRANQTRKSTSTSASFTIPMPQGSPIDKSTNSEAQIARILQLRGLSSSWGASETGSKPRVVMKQSAESHGHIDVRNNQSMTVHVDIEPPSVRNDTSTNSSKQARRIFSRDTESTNAADRSTLDEIGRIQPRQETPAAVSGSPIVGVGDSQLSPRNGKEATVNNGRNRSRMLCIEV